MTNYIDPQVTHYLDGNRNAFPVSIKRVFEYNFIKKRMLDGHDTFHRDIDLRKKYEEFISDLSVIKDIYAPRSFQTIMPNDKTVILKNEEILIAITKMDRNESATSILIYGSETDCNLLYEKFRKDAENIYFYWYSVMPGGGMFGGTMYNRKVPFEFDFETKDQYYPSISWGVNHYIEQFYKSKCSVLLIMGEPGSGKTSFVKNFIKKYSLNTAVTYDLEIMKSDEFYHNFMTDNEQKLLLVEDADALLQSREKSGNHTMTKLLNLSDGVIPLRDKKIIFTTNINAINKIDGAFIRPGRCFDVLYFDKLTFEQAKAAALVAGVPIPEKNRSYTLAELFNQNKRSYFSNAKVGF